MQEEMASDKKFPRAQINAVALKTFFGITAKWQLTDPQKRVLLGNPAETTYSRWKKNLKGELSQDTHERISYIMGIYKALRILFPNEESANQWLHKPNAAPLFNGHTALDKLLRGNVIDLADVRRYLDAERGW